MPQITKFFSTPFGSALLSIVLGLGLAALFRQACNDKRCIIIKGPPIEETANFYYKIHDNCFKYRPVVVEECD